MEEGARIEGAEENIDEEDESGGGFELLSASDWGVASL